MSRELSLFVRDGVLVAVIILVVGVLGWLSTPTTREVLEHPGPDAVVALVSAGSSGGDRSQYVCAGFLVSATTVVTAAHCVAGLSPGDIDVLVGVDDLCDSSASERHQIQAIDVSERLDVARLRFDERSAVTPMSLGANPVESSADVVAYGWGDEGTLGPRGCEMKVARLQIVGGLECAVAAVASLHVLDTSIEVCAKPVRGYGSNTCRGDSGGPLVSWARSEPEVVAMTDWGILCGPRDVGGYISSVPIAAWLDSITE